MDLDYLLGIGLDICGGGKNARATVDFANRAVAIAGAGRQSEIDHGDGATTLYSIGNASLDSIGNACPDQEAAQRLLFLDVDGVLHPLRTRLLKGTDRMDASHCFQASSMEQLQRVVQTTQARIVVSSSWRKFEHARQCLSDALAQYRLQFREWTTTAGGEESRARVDQIIAFVGAASNISAWAAVDDEDLAPESAVANESMMRAVFRQHFVRTDPEVGLDEAKANALIETLMDRSSSDDE